MTVAPTPDRSPLARRTLRALNVLADVVAVVWGGALFVMGAVLVAAPIIMLIAAVVS